MLDADLDSPIQLDHPLADGLVSWWLPAGGLNGGDRLLDATMRNPGTLSSGVTWAAGDDDAYAIQSNSTGRVVNSACRDLPLGATTPFTLGLWHRTRAVVSLSCPFGFGPDPATVGTAGNRRAFLQFGGGGNYYFWADSADFDSGVAWDADSRWHFAAFASDGATLSFHRDGVRTASTAAPTFFSGTQGTVVAALDKHPAGGYADMDFGGGWVYDRGLSDGELTDLYDQATKGFPDLLHRAARRRTLRAASAAPNPYLFFFGGWG